MNDCGAVSRGIFNRRKTPLLAEQRTLGKKLNEWIEKKNITPIVLSPHCDDAEISIGGEMYILNQVSHGKLILVIIFSEGSDEVANPYISHMLQSNGGQRFPTVRDLYEARKKEVLAADSVLEISGEQISFLGFQDLPFREAKHASILYSVLKEKSFALPYLSGDDRNVLQRLREIFKKFPRIYENPMIFSPIGGLRRHRDHQIVCLAAEEAFPEGRILYYDEYPYNLSHSPSLRIRKKHHTHAAIVDDHQQKRYQALLCFPTQLPGFTKTRQIPLPDELPSERLFIPQRVLTYLQSK